MATGSSAQAILQLPETGGDESAETDVETTAAEGSETEAAAEGTQEATTEGEQQPEASAADGQPEGETAEADIEVKLPDGVTADAQLLDEFKPLAKELGLKSEGAQKLVDLFVKAQERTVEKQREQVEQQIEEWANQAKAHKEFGGAKFEQSVVVANKALAKFGTPELQKLLENTGLCNHPELVGLFYRVGKEIAEDTIAGAHGSTPTTQGPDAVLRQLYPTMFQQE